MTLLVINPNTSQVVTRAAGRMPCAARLAPGCDVQGVTARFGAPLHRLRGQLRGRRARGARRLGRPLRRPRRARGGADRLLRRPGPVGAARAQPRAGHRPGRGGDARSRSTGPLRHRHRRRGLGADARAAGAGARARRRAGAPADHRAQRRGAGGRPARGRRTAARRPAPRPRPLAMCAASCSAAPGWPAWRPKSPRGCACR